MASCELPHEDLSDFKEALEKFKALAISRQENLDSLPTIANPCPLEASAKHLPKQVPEKGWGLNKSINFLLKDIAPTLNPGHAGPRYFGFVTGGTLPSALLSDWFTTLYDQNVQVHLPKETSSTVIESYTMNMIINLLGLNTKNFEGTLTSGATSSNLLALICAREKTLKKSMSKVRGIANWSAAEHGLIGCDKPVRIFVSQAHASIRKTAALAGIGRANVIDVGKRPNCEQVKEEQDEQMAARNRIQCLDFDLDRLERELHQCHDENQPAIVVISMGEVVTGALSEQTLHIRKLCNDYDAWLHMDAAFSAFVCLADGYKWVSSHMSVCDSITSDGHKALNVPYDCGILLVKKDGLLEDVCGPGKSGGPSYLASNKNSGEDGDDDPDMQYVKEMPSPLNRNLENSRRFRALPLYVSLLSQGREGTRSMVKRNMDFASRIREWLDKCPYYQVLTPQCLPLDVTKLHLARSWKGNWNTTIVFFRAHPTQCPVDLFKEKTGHLSLTQAIKDTKKVYVSPGSLGEIGGVRIAVSNWATGLNGNKDFDITTTALLEVMQSTVGK